MKIELKTGFWNKENEELKERIDHIIFLLTIGYIANIGYLIFNFNILMLLVNVFFFIVTFTINNSYRKYKKEGNK